MAIPSSLLCFLVVAIIASAAVAHPMKLDAETLRKANSNRATSDPPAVISWHIHVVYNIYDKGEIKRAMALREYVRQALSAYLGADCDDRYDFTRLCLIADHDFNSTLMGGPFPSGEWSIFVPVGYYGLVVPYMTQHHGEFSLLVHPNTGFEYEDHSDWALWAGKPWPLNMHIFEKGKQTNEFDHHRGDSDNPVCLPVGAQCGVASDAPLASCCFGSPCSCSGLQCFCAHTSSKDESKSL